MYYLMNQMFFLVLFRNFGTFKNKVRRTPMSSLYELAAVCDESGENNFSVMVGDHIGNITVPTYNWAQHLASYFRRVPGIKSFQYFRKSQRQPGTLFCYKDLDDPSPLEFHLLKRVWK